MVDLKNYFPQMGSTGERPPDGDDWSPGDSYDARHLNYLWDQLRKRFGDVEQHLDAIDSDGDGVVDEAEYAHTSDSTEYKGNDIDSDGDGRVDYADNCLEIDSSSSDRTTNVDHIAGNIYKQDTQPDDDDEYIWIDTSQ